MPTFPFGESITVHARSSTAQDDYGDPIVGDDGPGVVVDGCAVWPRASTENTNGQDLVVTGLTVLAPPGTAITATDQVSIRGDRYNVVGDVAAYRSPLTGTDAGVEVQLERVTG